MPKPKAPARRDSGVHQAAAEAAARPLSRIKVIDCSRVLAAPFATMLLADLGADVIKLEPPGGDETRTWGPPFWGAASEGVSAYFSSVNRNKRSVGIDLRTPSGQQLLTDLLRTSDVLVHNYLPSSAGRLGFDAQTLQRRHPRLIVANVAGFPDDGGSRDRPAYDLLAQAVSGLMSITGEPAGQPTKVGVAVLDLLAGLELAVGVLATLVGRDLVGASSVSVGLVETGVTSLANVLASHLATGEDPARYGNAHANIAPYEVFSTRGGHVAIAVGNDAQFGRLLGALGLADDAGRFASNPLRVEARSELAGWLGGVVAGWDRDSLITALLAADVPAGPVLSVTEAVNAINEGGQRPWIEVRDGIRLAPNPIRLGGARLGVRMGPPKLGQHTDEVLTELGLTQTAIADLRADRIVY